MKNRDESMALLREHVKSESLIKHALAVEAGMIAYAKHFNENIETWGLIGLLHDIDYEEFPETHPKECISILEKAGFDKTFITTILSHGDGCERNTLAEKALFAVDEMSSFLVTYALVRDPKSFEGMKLKSIKKKIKDKAFARAVNRENMAPCAESLNLTLEEHITILINGLSQREQELNEMGLSLL